MIATLRDYVLLFIERVPLFCESTSAISVGKNPCLHFRSKHIDIRFHFLRDQYEKRVVDLIHVDTDDQLADILTKMSFFKKRSPSRRKYFNKKGGKAYVGEWVTNKDSSDASSISCPSTDDSSDEEIVVSLVVAMSTKVKSSPSTIPSKLLCLMAKSDKVRAFDDSFSDDDDAPS
jgi:hypothetical protein